MLNKQFILGIIVCGLLWFGVSYGYAQNYYGNSVTMNMQSTSSMGYTGGSFATAASNIVPGTTTLDCEGQYMAQSPGRTMMGGPGWQPPTTAPIGDGWDVVLFMVLLAAGYGVVSARRTQRRVNEQ